MRWFRDERGVSPVIGVILMVAITVILAAVIASFVFGLGQKAPRSAPQAQIVLNDASESVNGNGTDLFVLQHNGGEDIVLSEVKVFIYYASNGTLADTLTWDSTNNKFSGNTTESDTESDGLLNAGDSMTFSEQATKNLVDSTTTFTVKLLHIPSNQFIFDGKVTVQ